MIACNFISFLMFIIKSNKATVQLMLQQCLMDERTQTARKNSFVEAKMNEKRQYLARVLSWDKVKMKQISSPGDPERMLVVKELTDD